MLEALELSDDLLDPGWCVVEDLGEVFRAAGRDLAHRYYGHNPQRSCCASVGLGVVAFVRQDSSRLDVGPNAKQQGELRAVVDLATRQMESEWLTVEICLEVDFG